MPVFIGEFWPEIVTLPAGVRIFPFEARGEEEDVD